MKRLMPLPILAVLIASCSSAGGGGPVKPFEPTGYYPLRVGTTWSYVADNKAKVVNKVVKLERVGNRDCAKIETTVDGVPHGYEHICTTAEGVFRCSLNGVEPSTPIKLLELPATPNKEWKIDVSVDGEKLTGVVKTRVEDIETKFGKVKALVADGRLEAKLQPIINQTYFVEGRGIIKTQLSLLNKGVSIELEKFEPGQ